MKDDGTGWLARESLPRTRPNRGPANYYRSTGQDGSAFGGIPLDSAEAAVVAAVRMAYKVAEAQIDRSARLGRRLREAGDRAAGRDSDRRAVDAAEHLVFKALMAGVGWIEAAAAENGSPLKRLATAQYRLLGAFLGLTRPDPEDTHHRSARAGDEARRPPHTSAPEERRRGLVRIQHVGADQRAVRVGSWEYAGAAPAQCPVRFYNVEESTREPISGHIVVDAQRSVTLKLTAPGTVVGGRWRAAVCDREGFQVGHIEIVL